jgi:hypothetical protein
MLGKVKLSHSTRNVLISCTMPFLGLIFRYIELISGRAAFKWLYHYIIVSNNLSLCHIISHLSMCSYLFCYSYLHLNASYLYAVHLFKCWVVTYIVSTVMVRHLYQRMIYESIFGIWKSAIKVSILLTLSLQIWRISLV